MFYIFEFVMNFSIKYHLLLKLQYFTYWDFLQDKNQFCLTNYKNNIKTINWLNKRKATRGFWETENLFSCFPTFTAFFPKCHSQIQFSISITRIAIHKMYIYKIILSTIACRRIINPKYCYLSLILDIWALKSFSR